MPVMMSLLLSAAMAAQGAPRDAEPPVIGYELPGFAASGFSTTRSSSHSINFAEQRLTLGSSLPSPGGLGGLGSAIRAGDARTSATALSPDSRLSVLLYDPADPSLPLNGLNAGAPVTAAGLGAAPGVRAQSFAVTYERDLIHGSSGGYDFTISQRAGIIKGPNGAFADTGTIARIGQNLDRERASEPSWYFFAGADAEALTIDPRQGFSDVEDSMRLQDYTLVGDAQAGIAWKWGPADVALAYVQKEREYSTPSYGITRKDDFGALSVTLRR